MFFFFSRLWRRAEVLTDNELLEIRYSGKPAAFLRAFKAGYFAILYNFIVMGWVINAMASVVSVMLNMDKWTAVWLCVTIAVVYAILSGFWGVVITDIVQFFIAMFGSIALAIIALNHVGGMDTLLQKLSSLLGTDIIHENTLKFIPPIPDNSIGSLSFWESPFSKFLIFITVMWWSHHGTDGGGYIIQRMSSAKNEKHALLATLWFNLAHYAVRVWPWIIVGVVSIVMFPVIPDSYSELGTKAGYPLVMNMLLGPGMKGILIVSFLAAFMSTIDTHLNWGASYIINDIYKRFFKPNESEKHYVIVKQNNHCCPYDFGCFHSFKNAKYFQSMGIYFFDGSWYRFSSNSTLVLVANKCMERNHRSFYFYCYYLIIGMSSMVASISKRGCLLLFGTEPILFGIQIQVHHKLIIIVPIAILSWLIATFITKPEPTDHLRKFYEKVQPGGWWGPITTNFNHSLQPVSKGILVQWVAGVMMIYGFTFGIGNLIFMQYGNSILLLGCAFIGTFVIWNRSISKL